MPLSHSFGVILKVPSHGHTSIRRERDQCWLGSKAGGPLHPGVGGCSDSCVDGISSSQGGRSVGWGKGSWGELAGRGSKGTGERPAHTETP